MLRGENIIIFAHTDLKKCPTSPEHVGVSFAQANKVLFIETFGSRTPCLERGHMKRVGNRLKNWFRGIQKQNFKQGQFYIYSPIVLMLNFRPLLFINALIFINILKRLIKKLDMKNPILYFYLPPPAGVIGKLREKAVIYHCVDEWATYPGGKSKIFMNMEKELIAKADSVIVTNELLYNRKKQFARRIYKIYHGVDYGHFAQEFDRAAPLPEDIKNISKPIIAVIGAFANWIDLDLIKLIAQKHKEWSIVCIGPVDSNVDMMNLTKISNIYYLGRKEYSELPNYYRVINVFIIPFLLNEHIKNCAPTRLYEHLSSGKPIVTTDFPGAYEVGEEYIYIASDKNNFVKKIEIALKEKRLAITEKRRALAEKNTWNLRIEKISEIIEEIIDKKVKNNEKD